MNNAAENPARPDAPRMQCRPACAACCIAPSINTPLPGMPDGKPAGVPCIQLTPDLRCALFGKPERPDFCGGLQASVEMCGETREYALRWLGELEVATAPASTSQPRQPHQLARSYKGEPL